MIQLINADCREGMFQLDAESVHCVVTSPPYWGLRDYGLEPVVWSDGWRGVLGLEPTLQLYVDHIVQVFAEVWRVLRKDGTVWLNMGDNFNSARGGLAGNLPAHTPIYQRGESVYRGAESGLKPKDKCLIPHRVAIALQDQGWYVRQDIVWAKTNCMPESVTDRPTTAHEYVFLLCKAERYFYDAEAVRQTAVIGDHPRTIQQYRDVPGQTRQTGLNNSKGPEYGRNARSVWTIPTHAYSDAHFATFPPKLVELCVKAGTSEHGCCADCGAPWERITERKLVKTRGNVVDRSRDDLDTTKTDKGSQWSHSSGVYGKYETSTTGWKPACTCQTPAIKPCTVLDPFAGAGTTGLVAARLMRHAVLIEQNPEYCAMARERIEADMPLFNPVLPADKT